VIVTLPQRETEIQTPCATIQAKELSIPESDICIVSIVRAGDSLMESIRECLPEATVGKILIQRDESAKEKSPKLFYSKLPPNISSKQVILCDPMLATGGSVSTAIEVLVDEGGVNVENIRFANVISCPYGIRVMKEKFPDVQIITACIDDELNEEKFIVPGLGDYGDRYFNTT